MVLELATVRLHHVRPMRNHVVVVEHVAVTGKLNVLQPLRHLREEALRDTQVAVGRHDVSIATLVALLLGKRANIASKAKAAARSQIVELGHAQDAVVVLEVGQLFFVQS